MSPPQRYCIRQESSQGYGECVAERLDITQALEYLEGVQQHFREAHIEAEFDDDGLQLVCRSENSLATITFKIEPM